MLTEAAANGLAVLKSDTAVNIAPPFVTEGVISPFSQPVQPRSQGSPGTADTLELAFETRPLRTICENESHAKCEFGSTVAEALKHRLADLRAATSIIDLVAGRPRVSDGANSQHMVVDLCGGYRIVFCPNHPNNPVTESGKLDWPKATRIKILGIESDDG